jgi:sulfite dehydrogenase
MTHPGPITQRGGRATTTRAAATPPATVRARRRRPSPRGMLLPLLAAATAAGPLAACGAGAGTTSKLDGEGIFTSVGCSSCHTLIAADATGVIGPDLDQKKPTAAHVEHQVLHGGGGMPSFKDQLTPQQVKAVAAYVAQATGAKGAATTPVTSPPPTGP